MATKKKNDERFRDIAQNRRALHEYAITDRDVAGQRGGAGEGAQGVSANHVAGR